MNQNQIKIIGSLSHGKYRKLHGLFIVEGAHVVDELLKSNWDIQTLVFTHEAAESLTIIIETAARRKIPIDTLNQKVFYKL